MNATILVAAMALVTVFKRRTPPYVVYLGRVLPAALIGMLVVYCLKDVQISTAPHGLPELTAAAGVVLIQVWKRNSLLSILAGTALYMFLIRAVF